MKSWRRRTLLLAALVWPLVSVLYPGHGAAEDVILCEAEPTDMPVEYGDFVDCEINSAGDSDIFRFSGATEEKIIIQATDQAGEDGVVEVCVSLSGPGDVPTPHGEERCGDVLAVINETIDPPGVYTIRVREKNAALMSYGLSLDRTKPPSAAASPLCFGCNIDEEIDDGGDVDLYIFNATQGQTVTVQATDQAGEDGSVEVCVSLFNPDDGMPTPHGEERCGDVLAVINETIGSSGVYTIRVREKNAALMSYAVDLQCVAGVCTTCGDGHVDPGEQCDDGNTVDGDGCSAVCLRVPVECLDQDGDGEADATDACPNTLAPPVDQAGCSVDQFCTAINATTSTGKRICKKSDWRNDEPLKSSPADCKVDLRGPGAADDLCVRK